MVPGGHVHLCKYFWSFGSQSFKHGLDDWDGPSHACASTVEVPIIDTEPPATVWFRREVYLTMVQRL